MSQKAAKLRELFDTRKIIQIAGAHNGLGAKLIEKNGFDGVWASGLEISTANGVPDANILTMTENLDACVVINDATALPVVCDCDTGYGNASNVIRMIKKYEMAGMAAAVIEDKFFPKVNSFVPGRQDLVTIDEFVGKLEAAKAAQADRDFMVFARVEALIAGWGMAEALKRAYAYAEAGADGIVIHSKGTTPDEIYAFAAQWKSSMPLVAIPTTYYQVTADELAARGFRMAIYANQGLRASIRAMDETFRKIKQAGSSAPVEKEITSMKQVFELQGMLDLKRQEEQFLKRGGLRVVIPAAGKPKISEAGSSDPHLPVSMYEIGGKTLLDHQADILRSCGAQEIHVVTGFGAERMKADGVKFTHNPDYASTGLAHSVMLPEGAFKEDCLVVYSDIVFDRHVISQLLTSPHDITLVMDRAYQALPARGKKLDLIVTEPGHEDTRHRNIQLNTFKKIRRIGREITPDNAHYEFTGIALIREAGAKKLAAAWKAACSQKKDKRFYESTSAEQADFNDLIQSLIDQGSVVYGFEISHGWSEIHSQEDYRRVRDYFERKAAQPALETIQ